MNPAILARLFAAQQAQQQGAMQAQQSAPPLDLQQEPGPLQWGTGNPQPSGVTINLNTGPQGDPGAAESRQQSIDDSPMPPSDYKYLDRVEGDGRPLGVMFGQSAGEPMGAPQNVPMSQLPPGAHEGQYISPLDIQTRRMSTRRP